MNDYDLMIGWAICYLALAFIPFTCYVTDRLAELAVERHLGLLFSSSSQPRVAFISAP